jgi:hypothetical protein
MNKLDKRSDSPANPFLTPQQRREDAEFRRQLNRAYEASKLPPEQPTPQGVTPAANGKSPETGGFSRPPRVNAVDNPSPPFENNRQSQGRSQPEEAKLPE